VANERGRFFHINIKRAALARNCKFGLGELGRDLFELKVGPIGSESRPIELAITREGNTAIAIAQGRESRAKNKLCDLRGNGKFLRFRRPTT
jgi:hypothetical protein